MRLVKEEYAITVPHYDFCNLCITQRDSIRQHWAYQVISSRSKMKMNTRNSIEKANRIAINTKYDNKTTVVNDDTLDH